MIFPSLIRTTPPPSSSIHNIISSVALSDLFQYFSQTSHENVHLISITFCIKCIKNSLFGFSVSGSSKTPTGKLMEMFHCALGRWCGCTQEKQIPVPALHLLYPEDNNFFANNWKELLFLLIDKLFKLHLSPRKTPFRQFKNKSELWFCDVLLEDVRIKVTHDDLWWLMWSHRYATDL